MSQLEQVVHEFVRKDFRHTFGQPSTDIKDDPEWQKVCEAGSQLWLDTGDIDAAAELWNSSFVALTTNNTLLNKEIQKGIYDGLVAEAANAIRQAAPGIRDGELMLELAFVLNAYHGLRLVETFDANVSVELHTDLAHDIERTVAYGKRYYAVCPERFYVKVPLTPSGYLAARRLVNEGIPINFTLGFSARHNHLAARLTQPKFVNVFLGRLNSFVADNELGDGENVGEKATLATQREVRSLRDAGQTPTRLIGASIRSGKQVATLAGVDVITMPTSAAADYRQDPPPNVTAHLDHDPEIGLNPGVSYAEFNGTTLWEVTDEFKRAVDQLLSKGVDALTADDLHAHFEAAGLGDFLPRWSEEDEQTARRDGKIPVYETWKEPLASGAIGLDALMNLSALHSFATDQGALDDHVASLLQHVTSTA